MSSTDEEQEQDQDAPSSHPKFNTRMPVILGLKERGGAISFAFVPNRSNNRAQPAVDREQERPPSDDAAALSITSHTAVVKPFERDPPAKEKGKERVDDVSPQSAAPTTTPFKPRRLRSHAKRNRKASWSDW